MSPTQYLAFAAVAAAAAYVQTLTGFALGLLLMGGVGITGIVPLPDAAIVVSALVLANAAQMLARGWRQVARRELGLILLAGLPAVAVGYAALGALAAWNDGLRVALGGVILISAAQLLAPGAKRATSSSALATMGYGAAGGLMSGLFSTAGPPLVFHLYRQPLPFVAVRETLVTIFAVNAVTRMTLVAAHGAFTRPLLGLAACALPAVVAATALARRWPPPLTPRATRGLVFALLALSGLSLGLPPLLRMVGRA